MFTRRSPHDPEAPRARTAPHALHSPGARRRHLLRWAAALLLLAAVTSCYFDPDLTLALGNLIWLCG